ncbi:MAG TPA: phosphatidylglycerol lysyltransferase domain-containing protein [Methanocorpusculum sp.]|nr:phosphatidylglycerol lysyltransferase domain-containing protein [Methanocorpusculum sp.]
MPDFKPVTLSDKSIFDKYFARYPQYNSEQSFVTIYSWLDAYPATFCDTGTHLILINDDSIYAPIGPVNIPLFEAVLCRARERNLPLCFSDTTYLDYVQTAHPNLPLRDYREYADYYYETETLAKLQGRAYLNVRKQINRFNARWTYTIEPISETNIPELLSFLEYWGARNVSETKGFKPEELCAVKKTFARFFELGCEGIALRIENTIRAFAVWELMPFGVAHVHYEKADRSFTGLYKIINLETARALSGKAKWINRESDVDSPGLREAKLRYHPHHLCKLWYIIP